MSFTNQILQPLADAFKVPLTLALGLAALIAVTRTASSLWYRIEHRGRHPLVIRTSDAKNERRGETEHCTALGSSHA
jgi:hypothetical protein